jgi:nicotinate phosphoribosyltransferase
VSGGLDEHDVAGLLAAGAPIGGFGVGTKLVVSADAPFLDMAYKLVELAGQPTVKLSKGKATLPGPKQVWRMSNENLYTHDVLELAAAPGPGGGAALLHEVMREGRRTASDTLEEARARAATERARLPEHHRRLESEPYEVRIGPALSDLRDDLTARLRS